MLARPDRLTRGADYKLVVRRGRRCVAGSIVGYVRRVPVGSGRRFGFIVSRQVGTAVTRNTVRRRLKALCFELRDTFPPDVDVVFRALPRAATAHCDQLRSEVSRCAARALT